MSKSLKISGMLMGILTALILAGSGCRMAYLFHAAAGQFRLSYYSLPVEEVLESNALNPEQKDRLRLVGRIKDFGEKELGLSKTQNYQTVYLKSHQYSIYTVCAAPKDRLALITWWFPIVGDMPSLGFFDLESAKAEKESLVQDDLDVAIGKADAYSTLGWFNDPVTLNLIDGPILDLVETILHEMTHTTLYVNGQGEFNEGLAVVVSKVGAFLFLKRTYGPSHPFTIEAKKSIEDQRLFSSFLVSRLQRLEHLYNSSLSYQEKLGEREKIFTASLEDFKHIRYKFQTPRFTRFGSVKLNNAYLMSIALYHRHFHLFEAILKEKGNSIREMLAFLQVLVGEIEKMPEPTEIISVLNQIPLRPPRKT
jgi:predicted aminopeptidase